MVEIVGFNEAYERATYVESVKRHHKNAQAKKIDKLVAELIASGEDAKTARAVAKSMAAAGLI